LAHSDHRSTRSPKSRHAGPVSTAKEAKDIAQKDTGGIAISARRIPLNGATGGWEVDVHMPNEDRGWRCIVDCDTHTVYTKDRIPNPPLKKQKKH
jgi:hypothetical protein